MTTKEKNRLIIEFMQLRPTNSLGQFRLSGHHCSASNDTAEGCLDDFADVAGYHRSWDWLMPIVEHLHNMGHRIVLHEDGHVEAWPFDDEGYCDDEAGLYGTDLIDCMYQAVIHIITKIIAVK